MLNARVRTRRPDALPSKKNTMNRKLHRKSARSRRFATSTTNVHNNVRAQQCAEAMTQRCRNSEALDSAAPRSLRVLQFFVLQLRRSRSEAIGRIQWAYRDTELFLLNWQAAAVSRRLVPDAGSHISFPGFGGRYGVPAWNLISYPPRVYVKDKIRVN